LLLIPNLQSAIPVRILGGVELQMADKEGNTQMEGRLGGAAEPYAQPSYSVAGPAEHALALKDRIHWSSIWTGFLMAFAAELVLGALILGISASSRSAAGARVSLDLSALGPWVALAALVSFFIGGLTAARLSGAAGYLRGLWDGVVVWALTLVIGTIAASLHIGGILAYPGMETAGGMIGRQTTQVLGTASGTTWWFFVGALVALIGAMIGGLLGSRHEAAVEAGTRHATAAT